MALSERRERGTKYSRRGHGMLKPLDERLSGIEARRRNAFTPFRNGEADVRSYPSVKTYLGKVIEDFSERFGNDNEIFETWHGMRVEMLDMPLGSPDFMKKSKEQSDRFDADYFTDPKTGQYSPERFQRVQLVIQEISRLVSRG